MSSHEEGTEKKPEAHHKEEAGAVAEEEKAHKKKAAPAAKKETKLTKDEVIAAIKEMTVIELADLVKALEEALGVSAAVPMMAAAPVAAAAGAAAGAGAAAAPAAEEQTEFTVILKEVGANKIQVIKAVRAVTNLGLKEAKELVEAAPKTIKEGANKADVASIKEKLTAAGATVEVK